jgi:hypothetical protein
MAGAHFRKEAVRAKTSRAIHRRRLLRAELYITAHPTLD